MLYSLPAVVKLWLQRSNVIGREMIHSVYLKQAGQMRSTPDGKWLPLTAEQWFNAERPGFNLGGQGKTPAWELKIICPR